MKGLGLCRCLSSAALPNLALFSRLCVGADQGRGPPGSIQGPWGRGEGHSNAEVRNRVHCLPRVAIGCVRLGTLGSERAGYLSKVTQLCVQGCLARPWTLQPGPHASSEPSLPPWVEGGHNINPLVAWLCEERGLPFVLEGEENAPGQEEAGAQNCPQPRWGAHPQCPSWAGEATSRHLLALP